MSRARSLPIIAAVAAIAAALLAPAPAFSGAAPTPAEYYKGRTINMIIGYAPGGGYDLYGRVLAQHMSRHIPGNPKIIPQNMPGAGSLKAATYVFSVGRKDGTTIGTFARNMAISQLIGHANFDTRELSWIGSITRDTSLCVSWHTSPIKTWNDVLTKQFTVGGEGADADPDIFTKLYTNLFGAKMRLASGFPGTSNIALAMQRGEVQGFCGLSWSTLKSQHPDWLRNKSVNLLIQAAPVKDPELPDVLMASDLVRNDEQKQILDFAVVSQTIARPIAAPPGIPADRKAALRAAFEATMKDPVFLADAKRLQLDVRPVSGADIDTMIAELYKTPKDVVAKAARAMTN
ncbi:MAG: Bug family tripartite tricarboxylate transporter substrate binding protein [Gammaproteobacteria bacterium]